MTATPLLSVASVACSFGGVRALDDVSLEVPRGSVVGLIGPNGAGKTTLFNIVSGFEHADAGRIAFDEVDISAAPPHERARLGIGRSFQHLGLMLDETAILNVTAALHRSATYSSWDVVGRPWRRLKGEADLRRRALDALRRFGLVDDAESPVRELSFGKARLVEIAAVAAQQPRLMLLDEPTTGLDVGEVDQLWDVLNVLHSGGATICVVAHDVRFVMGLCDLVYVLAEGKVLSRGTPAEVQRDPRVAEAYLGRTA
jgi:branched-chain amino acid transport system ATP-binding protein